MPDLNFIIRHLRAILALLQNKAWEGYVDQSAEGVWRSVWLIPIALILSSVNNVAIFDLIQPLAEQHNIKSIGVLPNGLIAMLAFFSQAITWVISILILVGMAQQAKAGTRITPLLILFNVSFFFTKILSILVTLIVIPLKLVFILQLYTLLILPFWCFLHWQILRNTIESKIAPTINILVILLITSFLAASSVTSIGLTLFGPAEISTSSLSE